MLSLKNKSSIDSFTNRGSRGDVRELETFFLFFLFVNISEINHMI